MKRTIYFPAILFIAIIIIVSSCSNKNPGRDYMPDMRYSRAYETNAVLDSSVFISTITDRAAIGHKIFYNSKPVNGTVRRGELFAYTLPNDSNGYKMSAGVKNPLGPLNHTDSIEAARLFNINCAICHGATGVANGPLSGKIGAIANLTLPLYVTMADGTMFHSMTYGKNTMGSYAAQLDRKQRWMIVQYIRTLQPKDSTATAAVPVAVNTVPDSIKTK
ncbi:MAG: cytochrome c [Chitinophagaceae bacterium]|nr:cytochrome c [Chitinophagaceae bacterium]